MKRLAISLKTLFVLLIFLVPAGCYHRQENYIPPGMPRLFNADYDRVWDAVVDTLDERGFVIKHMRKEEGYIATELKRDNGYRIKVSVRLVSANDAVNVTVSDYSESSKVYDERNNRLLHFWQENGPSGEYQQRMLDEIEAKLRRAR